MIGDVNGVSTCQSGEERLEVFSRHNKEYVQYDYRTPDGQLFSCVASSLEAAREKRDLWIEGKR